jgi:hypothetical protein
VLSGRGLCDGLITRPEESYRLWHVVMCDQETLKNEEAKARYRAVENTNTMGCNAKKANKQTEGKYEAKTLLRRLDKSGSIYRVRTYRRMYCSRIVSNARSFSPTILNKSPISPTPVKFRAQFILRYQTRLDVNYYVRLLVSELCGLLLWSTTWLFPPSAQLDRQTTACL